jgi:peroxiredoxin
MTLLKRLSRWFGWEAPLTNIAAGRIAPGFTLEALDRKEYALDSVLKRGPAVLAFFKISCPVCQFTLPFLQRLADRYAGENVSFLGISQDDARSTIAFNKEYAVKFPTLLDDDSYSVSNAYGLTTVPTIFLVAPDGTVQVSCMGFGKDDLQAIAAELAQYRKLQPAPLFRPDEVVPAYKPG